MGDLQSNEEYRISLHFDDISRPYVITTRDSEDRAVMSITTHDSEALLAGNPIGVIASNSIGLAIFDIEGNLNINNSSSPYFGKMRNGVQIEVEITSDGRSYEPFGKYYVDSWTVDLSDTSGRVANISGRDKLQYIGNEEIPKLPAYSGVRIDELVRMVFSDLKAENGDQIVDAGKIEIDNSLNLSLPFGITPGSRVRDFLNTVAQALLARVNVGKDDVIRITSAIAPNSKTWSLNDDEIYGVNFRHNESNIYNKVKINYRNPGNGTLQSIIELSGISLKAGGLKIDNLQFTDKALDIEQVYIETPDIDGLVSDITWRAYQGGIDVYVESNMNADNCVLVIIGRIVDGVGANELASVAGADIKVANILEIDNGIVQNQMQAASIANNLSQYLTKTNKIIDIESGLTPMASCGDQLDIVADTSEITGRYRIIETETEYGLGTYTKRVSLVKV